MMGPGDLDPVDPVDLVDDLETSLDLRMVEKVRSRLYQPLTAHQIGRYTVLEELGQGGMGMVYAAYDEKLDRKVAIKVLREGELATRREHERFEREAKALARLSHPNVVTIHEVGEDDDRMYLAMEFIRGQSLDAWLRDEPPWSQVLEVFVHAGRGLVAAHAADLIHRDFKPHNVMRSEDGRVKVLDFGLVRESVDESTEAAEGTTEGSSMSMSLTATGSVMGTPAYMSPEQHRGEPADARSDQYSFCISMWEGLTGTRPFGDALMASLLEVKSQGAPSWPDSAPPVPRPIVEAMRRGLCPDPDGRWPSMQALLDVIGRTPGARWRRGWLALGLGAALAGGGLIAYLQPREPPAVQPCSGAATKMAGVWDDARRHEVETAMLGVELGYAPGVWARAERVLSGYADQWVAMHTEACEASTVRGEQSAEVMDLRMGCLHRAKLELQATVDTLASANAAIVDKAHVLTDELPPLSRCADMEALAHEVEPPLPEEAEAVERSRVALAQARALEAVARYPAAAAAIQEAEHALSGVEYEPVRVDLAYTEGLVLGHQGKYDQAEARLVEGLELALRWRMNDMIAAIAMRLILVVSVRQQRADEGLRYLPIARGAAHGTPGAEPRLHLMHGVVLLAQGKPAEAEAVLRTALALGGGPLGPDTIRTASTRQALAQALSRQGKHDEAEAELRTIVALQEAELGPNHILVTNTRMNLAGVLNSQRKYEEAEAEMRGLLRVVDAVLGPDHPETATGHMNLGITLVSQHEHEAAEDELRTALAVQERVLGPDHPRTGMSLLYLGIALAGQAKYPAAEAALRDSISRSEKALGPDHTEMVMSYVELATLLLRLGRADEALPYGERAWAIGRDSDHAARARAESAFLLARVLWDASGDRERATALAREALRLYTEADDPSEEGQRQVAQWLEARASPPSP